MAAAAPELHRSGTHAVDIGGVVVGGGAPVAVQSMTSTDTADVDATTAPDTRAWPKPARNWCASP